MNDKLSILNLDSSYEQQDFYRDFDHKIIDLSREKGVSLYCDREGFDNIRRKLDKTRDITFIGSGNYHYITYILTRDIGEEFDLILFDNHTDMLESSLGGLLSCGSWVLNLARDNKKLNKIIMLGINRAYQGLIARDYREKVIMADSLDQVLARRDLADQVYLSIDKDVINRRECRTNWDQGDMGLGDLTRALRLIGQEKKIIGADVCGEYQDSQASLFDSQYNYALDLNNRANRLILESLVK